ncbi:universal stress protein [Sulfitobacter sp. F26169L]|uniref:universal stress protein n=1 Tax=Sulfitobacter sp. F26169L TaxID=2996015 RepID=UPI002260902B|nr:universal stress protein [Sulfitobacter sp. F26169L]MCX7566949.1 universal stress protein [Sulfitobacter sp. F26169L]
MFNKIVVGIDGSDMSEAALRVACDLAGKYSSELHLVHTPQPQTVAFAMGAVSAYAVATTMPSQSEVRAAGEKLLSRAEAVAAECGQTDVHTYQEVGDPAKLIVAYAEKCGADLIVTGRRGLGSLGALVQGSTSQSISHLAKCATLSVL